MDVRLTAATGASLSSVTAETGQTAAFYPIKFQVTQGCSQVGDSDSESTADASTEGFPPEVNGAAKTDLLIPLTEQTVGSFRLAEIRAGIEPST